MPPDHSVLSVDSIDETVRAIASVQRADGCIPWFPGGHADPWDLVEAAMALDVGGRGAAADAAYRWLARRQRPDGAWAAGYRDGEVTDPTLDANFCAYVAAGCWHHYRATEDAAFLADLWPVVQAAVGFTLDLQLPTGEIMWARDSSYRPWPRGLLTSSACIHFSLRCAIAIGETLGDERPDWELSLIALARAVERGDRFEPKQRFAMDWYYPVLGGVLTGTRARARLVERWHRFVVNDLGARCVDDRPWVTAGETCELVLALDAVGLTEEAFMLLQWVQHLRSEDGSYWTGATFPDGTVWPRERPTWASGAAVLAIDALRRESPTSGFFRGECFPAVSEPLADPL